MTREPTGRPKTLGVVTKRSKAFTLAEACVELVMILCSFTTTKPSPGIGITVLGLGCAEIGIPATAPLFRVTVADAVPLEDAWALDMVVAAVISPPKKFTFWTVDVLFALAPVGWITPVAV